MIQRNPSEVQVVRTIGVYGWTLDSFLAALRRADVRLLLDVRQRRGVRGSEYAWANAKRLEAALEEAGIGYAHHAELAPTTELREVQYRADDQAGIGKRSRSELAPEYAERYTREILGQVDLGLLVEGLPENGVAAVLRRARSGGVPSLADRRAPRARVRRQRRAPPALKSETATTSGTAAASSHHASRPSCVASAVAAIATTIPTATQTSSPTTKSTTASANRLMPAPAPASASA